MPLLIRQNQDAVVFDGSEYTLNTITAGTIAKFHAIEMQAKCSYSSLFLQEQKADEDTCILKLCGI